jgi:hypothetical protein
MAPLCLKSLNQASNGFPVHGIWPNESSCSDFKNMEERWRTMDKNNTLVIFDDHQSGFLRILQSVKFGFKYIMIEDNYPKF